jgi:hypothetical protein
MRFGRVKLAAIASCLLATSCSIGRSDEPPSPARDLASLAASSSPTTTPVCSWAKVRSANPAPPRYYEQLRAVTVDAPSDGWALGLAYVPEEGGAEHAILLHWDGRRWHPASDAFDRRARPSDISASSPTNAWVVGSEGRHGIAERWDGSRWTVSPLAEPATKAWSMEGVEALAPDDVWAVGFMRLGEKLADGFGPLVERWDGSRWNIVPTPSLPPSVPGDIPYARLDAVASSGPDDVWAVGEASVAPPAEASDTLVEHWDGVKWIVAATPDVASPRGVPFDHLFSGAVVSPSDMWAVGSFGTTDAIGGRGDHPLVLHWDGIRWTSASTPQRQRSPLQWSRLNGVAAGGANDVWVVGAAGSFTQARPVASLWDGKRWTSGPPSTGPGSVLSDVAIEPAGGSIWAVGSSISRGAPERTLIEVCRRD